MTSYAIQIDADGKRRIKCLRCGHESYNPNDIEQKYCGFCRVFHEDEEERLRELNTGR